MLHRTASPSTPVHTAYLLAGSVIAGALFGALPAIFDAAEYIRYADAPGVAFISRWALLLFLLCTLQFALGTYLILTPDWSSVGIITIALLASAGCYALILGLVLIASPSAWLVSQSGLQLADKLAGGQAALWCLCMISLQTLLAFFAGRLFLRWRM